MKLHEIVSVDMSVIKSLNPQIVGSMTVAYARLLN